MATIRISALWRPGIDTDVTQVASARTPSTPMAIADADFDLGHARPIDLRFRAFGNLFAVRGRKLGDARRRRTRGHQRHRRNGNAKIHNVPAQFSARFGFNSLHRSLHLPIAGNATAPRGAEHQLHAVWPRTVKKASICT
jgi:hypothetical protein